MASVPVGNSFYNVAPIPGDNNTGSGARVGWYGSNSVASSNTTISNINATSTSRILITPVATSGGNANAPVIISQTAGSFVVNWVAYPANASVYYYILG